MSGQLLVLERAVLETSRHQFGKGQGCLYLPLGLGRRASNICNTSVRVRRVGMGSLRSNKAKEKEHPLWLTPGGKMRRVYPLVGLEGVNEGRR